jgi:hypothetical protein
VTGRIIVLVQLGEMKPRAFVDFETYESRSRDDSDVISISRTDKVVQQ